MDTLVVSLTALVRVGLVHVSLDTVYIDTVFIHQLRLDSCEAIVMADTVQRAVQTSISSHTVSLAALIVSVTAAFVSGFIIGKGN